MQHTAVEHFLKVERKKNESPFCLQAIKRAPSSENVLIDNNKKKLCTAKFSGAKV